MSDEATTDIVPASAQAPANLFATDDPNGVVKRAGEHASALADVVRKQDLTSNIQGREHVNVEGWTLLGSMLGVFPVTEWSRPVHDEASGVQHGWEARVTAQTMDGRVVGAAEAQCTRDERTWANRDDFALRSMSQTRAVSKALRMPLGFVMQLAGFDATPTEDMPSSQRQPEQPQGHPQAGEGGITDAQQRKLRATCATEPSLPDDALAWAVWNKFGVASTTELTKKQASELIDKLTDAQVRQKTLEAWSAQRQAEESEQQPTDGAAADDGQQAEDDEVAEAELVSNGDDADEDESVPF